MRVVHIDARGNGCPSGFQVVTSPVQVCASTSATSAAIGCASAKFSTHGITYNEVRGYAYGHQVWRPVIILLLKLCIHQFIEVK